MHRIRYNHFLLSAALRWRAFTLGEFSVSEVLLANVTEINKEHNFFFGCFSAFFGRVFFARFFFASVAAGLLALFRNRAC